MPQSLRKELNHQVRFLDVCLSQVKSFGAFPKLEVLFFRLWEGNDLVQCGRQYPFVPSKCICGGTLPYICWISESCLTSMRLWRLALRLWDFKGALLWSTACPRVITSSRFMVCRARNPFFQGFNAFYLDPGMSPRMIGQTFPGQKGIKVCVQCFPWWFSCSQGQKFLILNRCEIS